MPRLSERQRLIHDIVDVMAVALMDEENDELLNDNLTADSDLRLISDVDDVSEMLQLVQSSRYLVYRERAISATQFHADIFLQTTPNSRFRTRTRMDKDSFKLVVDEIKDNPVFYNRSPFAHAPVWLQLAVALDRFGHYGSGASLNRSQELWDIRKGTADDYTDRVFKALNELSSRYAKWPSADERRQTSRRMASKGFRDCIGFIDGTTIALSQKPAIDGECFFLRSKAAL
ncbi:hypothetical protein PF007_g15818 [Phytophthora fragariae]|uniref:Uncharacterized protein n=2 Tax=Phytophthora fragariae TaxID=53985 RepID=A0A6A3JWB7_9STRA|nr:hypothetical protein PF011_g15430 [Phytophthora fragariae]KAE9099588.1 hypothetical protein PF007_g15818 [Phytophthora fragariae]KAE9217363.1 hypothetical protein PF004_g14178 [Phytophthora fragariae]